MRHSAVSVVDSVRARMRDTAIPTMPGTSTSNSGRSTTPPGRTISSTPRNPTDVDSARRHRIRSPSIGTASSVISSGAVNPSAYASASGITCHATYQLNDTPACSRDRSSTATHRTGSRRRQSPSAAASAATVALPNTPRPIITAASPAGSSAHLPATSPIVSRA